MKETKYNQLIPQTMRNLLILLLIFSVSEPLPNLKCTVTEV